MNIQLDCDDIIEILKEKYPNATSVDFRRYGEDGNDEPFFEVFIDNREIKAK